MVPLNSQTWSFYTFLNGIQLQVMQIYKPSWHKIVSDNVLTIISKCFGIFSNVQIEVIYQLQCVCCPICKPSTVKIL